MDQKTGKNHVLIKRKSAKETGTTSAWAKKKPRNNITPSGGFGFRVNLEPPGAQGTVQQKKKVKNK